MKRKLRRISLFMLLFAILFVILAFLTMDVPIPIPNQLFAALKIVYKVYPIVTLLLFVTSFFVRN